MSKEYFLKVTFSDEQQATTRMGPFDKDTRNAVAVALAGREDVTNINPEDEDD